METKETILFLRKKKEKTHYCFAFFRFRFLPILIITPISFVLFIFFLIAWLVTKIIDYELMTLFLSSTIFFLFFLVIFLISLLQTIKITNSIFNKNDDVSLLITKIGEKYVLKNITNKTTFSFSKKEVVRKRAFKKIIIVGINKKGMIAFPNTSDIKGLFFE